MSLLPCSLQADNPRPSKLQHQICMCSGAALRVPQAHPAIA